VLGYFLQSENAQHWEAIQNLASSSNADSADKQLRKYVLEAQRLTSNQRDIRVCVGETTIDGKTYKPGDLVIALFVRTPKLVNEGLKQILTTII
jgi:sulfite reductase alpha subunit-like flavoprotein